MITYTISGDTIEITEGMRTYIEKRFSGFERFMDDKIPHAMQVVISRTTAHEREDSIKAEVQFKIHTRDFIATGMSNDFFSAIDMAKEELMREVTHSNARRRTLFHHGARKIKNLMKGLYPFKKK